MSNSDPPIKRAEEAAIDAAKPLPKPRKKPGPKPLLEPTEAVLDQIRALGGIQATNDEAASVLRVSTGTFEGFMRNHPQAREAFDAGKDEGRASLRRTQFAMAEKNAAMAIWLGKQYLGQSEKSEIRTTTTHEEQLERLGLLERVARNLSANGKANGRRSANISNPYLGQRTSSPRSSSATSPR